MPHESAAPGPSSARARAWGSSASPLMSRPIIARGPGHTRGLGLVQEGLEELRASQKAARTGTAAAAESAQALSTPEVPA